MLKILLADDEPIIAKGVSKLIRWADFDAAVCGIAFDGTEALRLLNSEKPDILISDICMPGMSGIEILKHIHEHEIATKVIFLSGFQEFKYAQDALRFGALDYLLKPVDKGALEAALKLACDQIASENSAQQLADRLSDYEQVVRDAEADRFLDELVSGTGKGRSVGSMPFEELEDETGSYTVLAIRPSRETEAAEYNPDEESLIRFSLANIVENIADHHGRNIVFNKNDCICMIICHRDVDEGSTDVYDMAVEIRAQAEQRLGQPMTIGIGATVAGMDAIYQSYNSAMEALSARYFFERNAIIQEAQLRDRNGSAEALHQLQQELIRAFLAFDGEKVRLTTERLMAEIKEAALWNRGTAISLCMTTTVMVFKALGEMGIDLHAFRREDDALLLQLRSQADYGALSAWMVAYYESIYEGIIEKSRNKESIYIQKVKAFIDVHYAENITLETVAEIACMNAYYFSTFFKKQTGEKFKDYLTRARMEQAVRLLMSTDAKVYEIAEKVGFNDYRHFSDMFRKYYGKTPSEYKSERLHGGS